MTVNSRLLALTLATVVLVGKSDQAAAQIVLGVRVGYTSSNVGYEPEPPEMSRNNSFGVGGFLRIGNGMLSLQPEVLAVTKGAKDLDVGQGPGDLSLDYVEVPLFVRYRAFGGPSAPYLMVGPSIGFEIGCKVITGQNPEGTACDDVGPERASTDIGVAGAVGLDYQVGGGSLLLEGRYTHGFTDMVEPGTDTSKNRSFGAFVGFAFPLGGKRSR